MIEVNNPQRDHTIEGFGGFMEDANNPIPRQDYVITTNNPDSTELVINSDQPKKRQRKPWIYLSDHKAEIDRLEHGWFWDCVKLSICYGVAGLITGIGLTLLIQYLWK